MNTQLPLAELRALFRKSPAFRRVFLADVATHFGDGGLLIAFPMLILERTHDVTLTGLAFSGEILAFGLLSPVAGVWADRMEQKTLMLAANLVRVALFMVLLIAFWANAPIAVFMGLSVALGAAGAFFMPARAAFMRRLLAGEDLDAAIALEGTMGFLMRLVSPPMMGAIMAIWPATVGIQVDMAAYLLAAWLLIPAWVTGPRVAAPEGEGPGAWREGWRTILRSRALGGLLMLDVLLSLVGMAAFSITVAFLEQVLHQGAQANGWLLAATGLTGAVGTQLAGRVGRGPAVYAALAAAIALTYLLVPLATSLPMLMAIWSLRGLAIGGLCVLINQRIVAEVDAGVMGRVNAAWGLAACLSAFLGSAATPWLLRSLGPKASFTLFGLMLAGFMLVAAAVWATHRLRTTPAGRPARAEA
ncbi:MAG: MFS transporter [Candidatus Sericytochromatia bacterium]